MPLKSPIKSTDRRRQAGPPPIAQFRTPGGTPFNDRRTPTAGMPSYVRMGGR